ncbi:hypothetical protein NP493_364g01050 [Ridgeia piscesae]|uniref:PNPLA domain-containing protein n=1 Tax=Ridgeia piscesae TaxID=27915 RepID=A0AAD9L3X2_RIDPI|nr:hypothetical protein NP493_364g01050 [Ridgeia piscesae]
MTAALLAVGYDSYHLEKIFSADIQNVMSDHKFGLISLLPNLIKSYGWNPGDKLYKWFGQKMKERTGNADITFQQVYDKFGIELCIVTTNLNQMMSEYCHPKTTPDMPVRLAVCMSAAIPVYLKPVCYKLNVKPELFVDGGLLCNYPIHSFDGWWLSMKPEDQFLKKMQPLSSRSRLVLNDDDRFGEYNPATIGFLLYEDQEREVFQTLLDERVDTDSGEAIIPDTKLSRSQKERSKNKDDLSDKHTQLAAAADKFLQALQKQGLDKKEEIGKKDLEDMLAKESLSEGDLKVLFGEKTSADDIFVKLAEKKEDGFDLGRIAVYLEKQGLDLQAGYMSQFKNTSINCLKDFLVMLKETMVVNTQRLMVKKQDIHRTVGINTHYIGTLDFNLEQADVDFLIEQGRRSVIAFLRQYAERHMQEYKLEPPKSFCPDDLRRYIDDDLSEIIDPGDYSEKPPDK